MNNVTIRHTKKGVIIDTCIETRWVDAETWNHLVKEHSGSYDYFGKVSEDTPSDLWEIIKHDHKIRDRKLPGKVIKHI